MRIALTIILSLMGCATSPASIGDVSGSYIGQWSHRDHSARVTLTVESDTGVSVSPEGSPCTYPFDLVDNSNGVASFSPVPDYTCDLGTHTASVADGLLVVEGNHVLVHLNTVASNGTITSASFEGVKQ